MALSQWVPLFFICTWMYGIRAMQEQLPRGVADVAALSGYSLWLLTKSDSPAVQQPQSLNKRNR
ncbi:MAG: hypothetical protein KJO03_02160, partial [Gammaproteobacteria bacterium]|nr:hypothetical protein [Gammaproteobacteria bacterium]